MKPVKVKLTEQLRPWELLRVEIYEKITDILVDYEIPTHDLAFIRTYMPNAKVRKAKKKTEDENQPDVQTVLSSNQITITLIFSREYGVISREESNGNICFRVKSRTPSETISIDWGDGSPIETYVVNGDECDEYTRIEKSYEYSSRYNVTITGDITYFDCDFNDIERLNVSSNPELKVLKCGYNNLESLDVSKNPALTVLKCTLNESIKSLDVSANTKLQTLDAEFLKLRALDLTNNTQIHKIIIIDNKFSKTGLNKLFKTLHGNNTAEQKTIEISFNPAADKCDRKIAEKKGWAVSG